MAVNVTYLNNINEAKVNELLDDTQKNASYFDNMVSQMVQAYSKDMDELMAYLRQHLTQEEPIDTDMLERFYADLTNMIYFEYEKLEQLNVYTDMSKAATKEVYNTAYMEASSEKDEKGKSKNTVAENTAVAEMKAQYPTIVSQIYEHAYKVFKAKIEAATEMVATLKNILKKRTSEAFMDSQMSANTR